jgi:ABC-type multidrug transport system ATPase subunit
MIIFASNLGKKFRNEWIFRNLDLTWQSGQSYTLTGANGSGKSTLLQVLAGFIPANEGEVLFAQSIDTTPLESEDMYRQVVIASPYLELVEEFTLEELLLFHQRLKPFRAGISLNDFMEFVQLEKSRHKFIKYFSSGMKQRLKLGLAFLSDCPILMLDEPTANLDKEATAWYLRNVEVYAQDRLLVIASNQNYEYEFCANIFRMQDWKIGQKI